MKSKMITRRARETKGPVTLTSAEEYAGGDYCGEYKWYTICEDHGHVETFKTKAEAKSASSHPLQWCRWCAEEVAK